MTKKGGSNLYLHWSERSLQYVKAKFRDAMYLSNFLIAQEAKCYHSADVT
jgi:hypothetical protein